MLGGVHQGTHQLVQLGFWLSIMGLMMVLFAAVILTGSFIQGFHKIVAPFILILKTSSSINSSTSVTQIVIRYNEFDDGDGKSIKNMSKIQRIVKSGKTLKAQNVAKIICSEES